MNADPRAPTLKIKEIRPARPHVVNSHDLFRDESQVLIVHEGSVYTLRRTRENKLILTK